MKAKVIETGEIVNVTPYPTWYQEKGQCPDRREWDGDELEFIHSDKKEEKLDLEKEIASQYENYEEYLTYEEFADIAKHFYSHGIKAQKGE